jgi:outer membrane protein assembly factor BamD
MRRNTMRVTQVLVLTLAALALSACGVFTKKEELSEASAEKLFREAKETLNGGDYPRAITLFEQFEAKFPYGAQAQQAILDASWANYKTGEYAAAVSGAERFIKLYPSHPNVDYAYFLKGLALFGDELGLFRFLANEDITERDPKARREAYSTFRELVEKFPNSGYAADARLRMQHLLNSLANYEVHVARYYYNRGAYVAAINRAQAAVTSYPETPAGKEALQILAQSYGKLGKDDLAKDANRVLERTFATPPAASASVKKPWWKIW